MRKVTFLPRDTMRKCGLCRCAVSVRLSVTFVYSVETNKHIFKNFSPTDSHTILVFFHTKRYGNYSTPPPMGASMMYAKIAILGQYLAIGSMTAGVRATVATIDRAVYRTDRIEFITVCSMDDHDEEKRREEKRAEFNCTQR